MKNLVNLSLCFEMYWAGLPAGEKMAKLSFLGFEACEFWGFSEKDIIKMSKVAKEKNLKIAVFCMEPGNCLTRELSEKEAVEGLKKTQNTARLLKCNKVILCTGNEIAGEEFGVTLKRVVKNLKLVMKIASGLGLKVVLEPLNTIVDHKGHFLTKMADAARIVEEVGSKNLKLLMDIYHQQITEGNIINNINKYSSLIGHYHTAGVPGRHELTGGGELNYLEIFKAISKTGYTGFVGLEYTPVLNTEKYLKEALKISKK